MYNRSHQRKKASRLRSLRLSIILIYDILFFTSFIIIFFCCFVFSQLILIFMYEYIHYIWQKISILLMERIYRFCYFCLFFNDSLFILFCVYDCKKLCVLYLCALSNGKHLVQNIKMRIVEVLFFLCTLIHVI